MSDVLVLCYHAMSRDWGAGFSATPDRLEAQIGSLLERGYEGATFSEAVNRPLAERTLAVTFDDSYRSVIELAAPVLARLGVPGTVFVPTTAAGSERPMAWPGIDHWLGGPREQELMPMSWDELRELAMAGWEIGSHTRTHPRLPELEDEKLRTELEGSRSDIEERIDGPCTSLAFPYGDFDAKVVAATRAAGFTAAGGLAGRVASPAR